MEKITSTDFKIIEEPKKPLAMHPKKFAMWLFMASVMMLFAALTSAYIVRQAEGNWLFFELPTLFTVSTVVIVLSSVSMQAAFFAARKNQVARVRMQLAFTFAAGLVFLVLQVVGWQALVGNSVFFVGNPSGSFLYVITGLHGLHIVSALVFLLIVWAASLKITRYTEKLAQMEMCTTYWHFLGVLWVYLYVFLLLNR
jgi:cytochrome c oxidase subunit 3